MLCSTKDVFCPDGADNVRGSPLVTEEEDILIGLASWHQSCTTPLVKNKPVGVYANIAHLKTWILQTVYSHGGPGTGICCRGNLILTWHFYYYFDRQIVTHASSHRRVSDLMTFRVILMVNRSI